MKVTSKKSDNLEGALSILGDKWTALLVRELAREPLSFCKLETSLENISPRTLSQRLNMLEHNSIINKRCYCQHPKRYKYELTSKGQDLQKVLSAMSSWGAKYAKR